MIFRHHILLLQANIFVHFVPINHDQMNEDDRLLSARTQEGKIELVETDKKEEGEIAVMNVVSSTGESPLHAAARSGDLQAMRAILEDSPLKIEKSVRGRDAIHARDTNGWQAVHEAAR